MKMAPNPRARDYYSVTMLAGMMLILLAGGAARSAELVVFEQAGCAWCEAFEREIAPIYPKTREGRIAPLRRVDIEAPLPTDLAFIEVERLAPVFVLIDQGREIGRIRGYPGEDHFWGLLGVLIDRIVPAGMSGDRAELTGEKSLRLLQ